MPDRPIRCPYNNKLKCWIAREKTRERACPFKDRAGMEALEVWAYTGRTPRSATVGFDPSYGQADKSADAQLVRKAEMFCNFNDGAAVCAVVTGENTITMVTCKDMIRGLRLWRKKKAAEG